jgi:REP element-mobilizing transposase RayT
MKFDPRTHQRQSMRLEGYDYGQAGLYFVTITTWQMECLFGVILEGEMVLNDAGRMAEIEWKRLVTRFPGVELDAFVVMPNHVHGIVVLGGQCAERGEASGVGRVGILDSASPVQNADGVALGNVVGAYKSRVARMVNGLRRRSGGAVWHRNYYEHIIRDDEDLERVRWYIAENPGRWNERDDDLK